MEAALTGNGKSQQEIAAIAGVSEFQVSRWYRNADFTRWVAHGIDGGLVTSIKQAGIGLCRSAARGNVPAFNAVADRAERWGLIPTVSAAADGAQTPAGTLVNGTQIYICGIPEMASRSTLPPVLELPAAPGAAPPPPPAK